MRDVDDDGAGPDRRTAGRRPRRAAHRPERTRRSRQVVRHVDAWSVLKISAIFYVSLYLILLVAGVLLWLAATATGLRHNVEKFIADLIASGKFHFVAAELLQASIISGAVLVVMGTAANVVLTVLYNLISDIVGGLSIVVEDRPARRRALSAVDAQPSPMAADDFSPPRPVAAPALREAPSRPLARETASSAVTEAPPRPPAREAAPRPPAPEPAPGRPPEGPGRMPARDRPVEVPAELASAPWAFGAPRPRAEPAAGPSISEAPPERWADPTPTEPLEEARPDLPEAGAPPRQSLGEPRLTAPAHQPPPEPPEPAEPAPIPAAYQPPPEPPEPAEPAPIPAAYQPPPEPAEPAPIPPAQEPAPLQPTESADLFGGAPAGRSIWETGATTTAWEAAPGLPGWRGYPGDDGSDGHKGPPAEEDSGDREHGSPVPPDETEPEVGPTTATPRP